MRCFYLSKEFARLARRSKVADEQLWDAIDRAEAGAVDAEQRVARPGKGRSGGFRTIIAYRRGGRAIFLHLFAKAQQANLGPLELETYQELARAYDRLNDSQLDELVARRGWRRIETKDGKEADSS
jgi:hypothetical protein